MGIKIALAGNPNSGKTTLFNSLTGSNQFVGNWPGVTVEKKEGKLKGNKEVIITDLPGIYSLSPYTLEEVIARDYLINEKPDAVLNIVDGTNIERNLYLTTQILELGIPVVVAINMMDAVKKTGDRIDTDALSKELGCPVVPISALKGTGVDEAANAAVKAAKDGAAPKVNHQFSSAVNLALSKIKEQLGARVPEEQKLFYAVKLFERDNKVKESISGLPDVEQVILECEEHEGDDSESIITNERYQYITIIIEKIYKKKNKIALTVSDKIDKVVTNRWLALPIFAAVMFVVYFIAVTTVGAVVTDWTNDSLFGDGWFLLGIGSADYEEEAGAYEVEGLKIEAFEAAAEEAELDIGDAEAVRDITVQLELTDEEGEIEEILTVNYTSYLAAMAAEEPDPSDFGPWVPGIPVLVGDLLEKINTADWLQSLICDGIIAGVGAVLGFVPQMLVLFLLLAILESIGYMARIAFIMDRIFRKFGLSGKSFIPMLIGTGCGVPGIMASRTIENERDRRMTIMTTTFMPCGAKLPIIGLIAGALFGGAWWVAPTAYFIGIAAIIVSGIILKKTKMFSGDPAPFVMELPAYHVPGVANVLRSMWERGWSFIKKAGTIILLSTIVIWFTSRFGFVDGSFGMLDEMDLDKSILAYIGKGLAWIFVPLGFGDWKSAVATVTGLVAKENVVGTFGILYGFAEVSENGNEIWANLQTVYTALAAFSFLTFNLLCAPCFAAIGAIKREMNSAKWTWFAIGYQTVFAYVVAMCIYQIGMLVTGNGFNVATAAAFIIVAAFLYLLLRPNKYDNNGYKIKKAAGQRA